MDIKKIFNSELFVASFVLFVLINLGNFINYIYQFSMARLLGPASYSILAVLISMTYIFGIPTTSIQAVVSKNITKLKTNLDYNGMKRIFLSLISKLFLISIIIFGFFSILSFYIYKPLNTPLPLMILTGAIIITS